MRERLTGSDFWVQVVVPRDPDKCADKVVVDSHWYEHRG
jgi:hypothetical protein